MTTAVAIATTLDARRAVASEKKQHGQTAKFRFHRDQQTDHDAGY
ncbi:hypothetical protein [Rhizobium leguminosarum]|nr:hypothetical protein [Rhizobium leguminosarum]